MKKIVFVFSFVLLSLVDATKAQNVSLTINAGLLETQNGASTVSDGMLLQLIASPSGSFPAPTSNSFVSGDNVLVASFAMNSFNGKAGFTSNALSNLALTTTSYSISTNEPLLLRFYPTITYSTSVSPSASDLTYGQVRSSTVEAGYTDASQAPWVVPAASSAVDLDYVTLSAGGSYSNSSAYAVPEPSCSALFACMFVGLTGLRFRNRIMTLLLS